LAFSGWRSHVVTRHLSSRLCHFPFAIRHPAFRLRHPAFAVCLLAALAFEGASGAAESPGITEPFLDVTLSASVPGIVVSRKFKEGDFIQEGQVLMELDKRLEELEVDRRRLVRDQKKNDFTGTQKLFSSTRGVSKEDLEKKEVDYRVAAVEHDMAEEQLRRRQLISPLSGTISEIMLEVGESCTAYQSLIRVVDTRRCYFVTNVEARQAAHLKTGQTLSLELDSGTGPVTIQAQISLLAPIVDPASGLRRVKLLFDNPNARIVPGVAGKLLLE
jgi:RND family efflux transporter MFP subunit